MRNPLRKSLVHSMAAAVIAVGAATAPTNAEETFIFAHPMNTDHVFHAISERYLAALADQEDLTIEYHPGGDLGDWTSLFEQAIQGVVPMTLTWASSDFDKRLDLIYLGYIVSNWEEAKTGYGPGAGMLEVCNDMLGDLGIYAMGIIPTDFGSVVIRKGVGELPMNFPDEPAGMKIRVPGCRLRSIASTRACRAHARAGRDRGRLRTAPLRLHHRVRSVPRRADVHPGAAALRLRLSVRGH